ncbi:MAG: hypothetical protein M9916_08010 [Crocinitomicaceae bacterium]|nr:hypothetical protein [Crocinitomicaceae bacterium]
MKQVSYESVEKAIQIIDNLDDQGLEKIANEFSEAQPVLIGYAMSAAQEFKNERLHGLLIYYFCLLFESFRQEGIDVKQIMESDVDEFEEPFFQALDSYFQSENIETLEEFIGQSGLVQFMTIEISTPDVDGTSLDDETATQLFIVSLAIIYLMANSIKA